MKVKKVIVDSLPTDCKDCPLKPSVFIDCGRSESKNYNGGVEFGRKIPDQRCRLEAGWH